MKYISIILLDRERKNRKKKNKSEWIKYQLLFNCAFILIFGCDTN